MIGCPGLLLGFVALDVLISSRSLCCLKCSATELIESARSDAHTYLPGRQQSQESSIQRLPNDLVLQGAELLKPTPTAPTLHPQTP